MSPAQFFRTYLNDGEITLYFDENRIIEAIIVTKMGIAAKEKHNASKEGGKVLVRIMIMMKARNWPIT